MTMAKTIITLTTQDPLTGHPVTQGHHQETEEITLHPDPQGDGAMVVDEEVVEVEVTEALPGVEVHPHQAIIEGIPVGFICHPQLPFEETPPVYMKLQRTTEVQCMNNFMNSSDSTSQYIWRFHKVQRPARWTHTPWVSTVGGAKFSDLENWLANLVVLFKAEQYGGEDRDREHVLHVPQFIDGEAKKWSNQHVLHVRRTQLTWSFEEVIIGLYDRFIHASTMQDTRAAFFTACYSEEKGIQGFYDILVEVFTLPPVFL
jgi:hypothetical protein